MSILGEPDDVGYDEAEELVADLKMLVNCGFITAIREVGGPTRYGVAPRDDDSDEGDEGIAGDAILSAG